jgi:hypothetical protein
MPRYVVTRFDGRTFQVIDLHEDREVCVCSDYDERSDSRERAQRIAYLLNLAEPEKFTQN